MKMSSPFLLIGLLMGCTTVDRTPPPEKLDLAPLDSALTRPCRGPKKIPEGDRPLREVLATGLADRTALVECRHRHSGLVEAINSRDAIQGR